MGDAALLGVLQFASGVAIGSEAQGGVAFWAHIGGFVAGVVLVKLFERRDRVLAHLSHHWRPGAVVVFYGALRSPPRLSQFVSDGSQALPFHAL